MIADTYRKMFLSLHPKNLEKFSKEKKDSAIDGAKIYLLAWAATFVLSIITLSFAAIRDGITAAISGQLGFVVEGPMAFAAFITLSLFGLVWGLAAVYAAHYAGSYVARNFFNGKGTFESQFHLILLFSGAIMVINSVLILISTVLPVLEAPVGFLSLLIGIYGLYLIYLAMKSLHKIEMLGAVLSTLVILITQAVVFFLIAFFMGVLLMILGIGPSLPTQG